MSGVPILFGFGMSAGAQLAWVLLWLVLVTLLVVALVVLALSRWGRSQPVRICVVLSLLVHVLLAGYAATIQIVGMPSEVRGPQSVEISLVDGDGRADDLALEGSQPLEATNTSPLPVTVVAELPKDHPAAPELLTQAVSKAPPLLSLPAAAKEPLPTSSPPHESSANALAVADVGPAQLPHDIESSPAQTQSAGPTDQPTVSGPARLAADDSSPDTSHDGNRRPILAPLPELPQAPSAMGAQQRAATSPAGSDRVLVGVELPSSPAVASELAAGANASVQSGSSSPGTAPRGTAGQSDGQGTTAGSRASVPDPYRSRVDVDRVKHGARRGGTPEAEAAVQAGLRWLSLMQSDDGHWDAARYGAGRELRVAGSDRQRAGATADSAMTGLALLAFLGSGDTHLQGPYKQNVRRGLEYLTSIQRADGSLAGNARLYEAMYCHGMASFALSEACAMTGDNQLRPAVSRAAAFIVASQHPTTGGWRYQPGDPGDTSQLGWQVMALRSAELAGLQLPDRTRDGVRRFLTSVSSGPHGGLASYRPGEKTSRTMTAEALACRQFMGLGEADAAAQEAANYIVEELPGQGDTNLYYWYYATVSMYQLQDEHWQQWNQAMQRTLLAMQRHDGEMAGSWDADGVWGGYGGRIFSTSLATLCLEVYYRYLPVYSAGRGTAPPRR